MKLLWVTAKRMASDLASTTQLAVSAALSERGWSVTIVAPGGDGAEAILFFGLFGEFTEIEPGEAKIATLEMRFG